jgi:hypothetical protein
MSLPGPWPSKGCGEGVYVRPGDKVKDILRLLCDTLALLRIFPLHLADCSLLPRLHGIDVDLGDGGECALEARSRVGRPFTEADEFEAEDVRKGDDVVVAGLAGERCGRVWRGGRRVDGDGVHDVACSEESTLEHAVVGSACDFDAANTDRQLR